MQITNFVGEIDSTSDIDTNNLVETTVVPNGNCSARSLKLHIPQINNKRINVIVAYRNYVFIGGANGMLLKYGGNGVTQVFVTNTAEDILQIETTRIHKQMSLFAFTRNVAIVYKTMDNHRLHRDIDLPGIRHVFNDGVSMYVPADDGAIYKLHNADSKLARFVDFRLGVVSSLVMGATKNKSSLINLEDGSLYKATKKNVSLRDIDAIDSVSDVRRVMRVRLANFLYQTDDTVWLVNSDLHDMDHLQMKYGIKLVDLCHNRVAVVDRDDSVHVYLLTERCLFGQQLCSQRMSTTITAVSVTPEHVYISSAHTIFKIQYKL